jgi:hypothetical protein
MAVISKNGEAIRKPFVHLFRQILHSHGGNRMLATLQGVEPSGEEGVFEASAKKRAEPQTGTAHRAACAFGSAREDLPRLKASTPNNKAGLAARLCDEWNVSKETPQT